MGYWPLSLHESPNTINLSSGCFQRLSTRRIGPEKDSSQPKYRMPHTARPTTRAKRVKSFTEWCFDLTWPEKKPTAAVNNIVGSTELKWQWYLPWQIPHHQCSTSYISLCRRERAAWPVRRLQRCLSDLKGDDEIGPNCKQTVMVEGGA